MELLHILWNSHKIEYYVAIKITILEYSEKTREIIHNKQGFVKLKLRVNFEREKFGGK